jgi:dynein heavy chain 1
MLYPPFPLLTLILRTPTPSFDESFAFVKADKESATDAIHAPEGMRREHFLQWADNLPDVQSPTWLGLPSNAELVLLTNRATALAADMQKLQTTEDEDEDELPDNIEAASASTATPAWMRALRASAGEWLRTLPDSLPMLQRSAEKIKDPLFRFFEREVGIGSKLLRQVRSDLDDVIKACDGEIKQTNHLRSLMVDYLNKGIVAGSWRRYKVPKDLSVAAWIADFSLRVQQLQQVRGIADAGQPLQQAKIWAGGLFVPEAYVTATRQAVAQSHNWALEKLVLSLDVRRNAGDMPTLDNQSFLLTDMRLDGATAVGDQLQLSSAPFSILPLTVLRWNYTENPEEEREGVRLPVYLNGTRAELIFTCYLKPPAEASDSVVYARGIALACSSLSGLV